MPAITASSVERNQQLRIVAAFAAVYIVWGTTYLAIRVAVETIPPFFMAGVRFLIAGTITFVFLRYRGVSWPSRIHWRSALIIGAFLLLGGNGLVTWSEQQVPSSVAALVVATMPLWMTLFDWLIFKGSRPTARVVLGLVMGFIGMALLLGPGLLQGTTSLSPIYLVVLLLAPLLWSLGSLISRRAQLPAEVFMATAMEMLAGSALLLLAALLTGEFNDLRVTAFSARSLLALAYLITFGAIIGYTAYIWLLKNVSAARASTYTYVNPVIAVFLGWLLLSEPITALTLAAVVIIVAAVILITSSKSDGRSKPAIQDPAPTAGDVSPGLPSGIEPIQAGD